MADYTSKFDGVDLEAVCVPVADLPEPQLEENIKAAFDVAFENISKFHEAQKVRARGEEGWGLLFGRRGALACVLCMCPLAAAR